MNRLKAMFSRIGALRQLAVAAVFVALVTVLMLWLAGRFNRKISPTAEALHSDHLVPSAQTVEARLVRIPVTESAVGTIQAMHETTIASRILSRVVGINLKAGQSVQQGDVLVRLDDTDLAARLQQAKAASDSAKAEYDQAVIDEHRLEPLVKAKAISQTEYDKAATALKTTEANLARAQQAVAEEQAVLAYATIASPMDGIVVDKKVDVGDMVTPGQPLVTVYDPHRMQLVASVRESLARRLKVGQEIGVRLDAMDRQCTGQVSEMVPDAQSASRTFQVKVTGPCPPGLYTGMFGRIIIPLQDQDVLVIPASAIRRVGQLELVDVVEGPVVCRRAIRTGQTLGDDREVLSGLKAGEKVVLQPSSAQGEPS
ncbi:MAG: efflux RND transporter periplasmic adaptor subunit [Tepidisphaeraceae bacterium]|jgi:RND family efflux transporter MFP subunit